MQYEVIKGRINGKVAGEIVELDEKTAKAYGIDYLLPLEGDKKSKTNKALSAKDATTKDEQGGTNH